jgi:CBS domain containing-hemolysin-like protein
MTGLAIGLSLLLVLLNGAFVAVEFAVIGARRPTIDALAADGRRNAVAAQRLQADILTSLSGAQIGITVCSLILGRLGEPAVAHLVEAALDGVVELSETMLHTLGFAGALTIVVVIHMVVGEMVPKNLALAGPDRVLLLLARPTWAYLRIARPVNNVLQAMANGVMWLVRVEPASEILEVANTAEIALMVRESHQEGLIDAEERALIEGALRFGDTVAEEMMAPMAEVEAVGIGDTVAEIERRFGETPHTRLVVIGDGPDDIRGFVHSKDLLGLGEHARTRPLRAAQVRPMLRVAPRSSLPDVLQLMRRARIHLAQVTAEGVSLGVLTLDDVLRGLVGTLVEPEDHAR